MKACWRIPDGVIPSCSFVWIDRLGKLLWHAGDWYQGDRTNMCRAADVCHTELKREQVWGTHMLWDRPICARARRKTKVCFNVCNSNTNLCCVLTHLNLKHVRMCNDHSAAESFWSMCVRNHDRQCSLLLSREIFTICMVIHTVTV